MVVGVGIELVEVPRFERAVARRPDRLCERLFLPGERAYASARTRGVQSLAVRFAAKSAARSALSGEPGARGVAWHDVEVVRERGRAPTLRFHGEAARRAQQLGVDRVALSLTHDRSACVAHVVLEREAAP